MPLSKKKQVEYMREYRKRIRYNVIPNSTLTVIPKPSKVPEVPLGTHRIINGVPMIYIKAGKDINIQPKVEIPLYNPSIHKAGDTVKVIQYGHIKVITIPEIDGDGNIVWR